MNGTKPRPTSEPALAPVISTATEPLEISKLRELPAEWQRLHGFGPLLTESFHDPARHQGTLCKVTNWTPLGFTKATPLNP